MLGLLAIGFYSVQLLKGDKTNTNIVSPTPTVKQVTSTEMSVVKQNVNKDTNIQLQGNLQNTGYVALMGEDLIYSHTSMNILTDSGNKQIVTDVAFYINVDNQWIYYANKQDNDRIYKIKKDGSGKTALSEDSVDFITKENEWLYYTNKTDGYKIYKIKTDGSSKTKINDEESFHINIVGEWLYYRGEKGKLIKQKVDGTNRVVINEDSCMFVNVVNDWIYYINLNDKNIYKIKIDGSNKQQVVNGNAVSLNVDNDWIYYSLKDKGIFKQKIDNGKQQLLTSTNGYSINVANDRVFFISDPDSKLMSVKNDGTDLKVHELIKKPDTSDEIKKKAVQTVLEEMKKIKNPAFIEGVTAIEIREVQSDRKIVLQVYNVSNNKTETINWYTYDPKTGKLTARFKE